MTLIPQVLTNIYLSRSKIKEISWTDSPETQKLLDVISSIIADEYIEVAKQNRDVFEIASAPSGPRNDGGGEK